MLRGRKARQKQSRRERQKREQASIQDTVTTAKFTGIGSVDPDILVYAVGAAKRMGQSSEQAALEAARLQLRRNSGKRVTISDNGLGWHGSE
jgi:hypothetical protein